ncbi:molybdopterin-dependent oxidoreductase [Nakamurella sp. YIM 132087]|uniref:Molybdopterin-dependent oxidoreductase n=1 Tax=Nakamurella alba TaxID=2665158 RepID=A0A7K1FPP6_9ACTN|nr:molybdopterin-dependent oxidoreductase [Nakamurella alba]MTD16050.1 molybdopterin-dependent oxidoreductase [Nakamurella alba]
MTSTTTPPRPAAETPQTPWLPTRWAAALVGIVAVGLTFGIAELLAAVGAWTDVLSDTSSPLGALGAGFIRLTPLWLERFAITTFGTADKTVLRIGMAITVLIAAGLVGVLARRSPRLALAAAGVLVVITGVAVLLRHGSSWTDLLPLLVGAAAGLSVLVRAFRRQVVHEPAALPTTTTIDRRNFLRVAGMGAAVAVVTGVLSRLVPSAAEVQASRAAAIVPVPGDVQKVTANFGLHENGLSPYITPNDDFYRIDTVLAPPLLRAEDWLLRVHGLVDNEITIGYGDLVNRPQVQRTITLTCVSNEVGGSLIGNATWIGARLQDLLAEAGPQEGADCVLCTSTDGFTSSTPLEALTDGRDALLAVAMNGEILPVEHGFPVRMVVPGLYGYVSATKWVVDLEVTRFADVAAYWTVRGWSDHGPIKTSSRFDVPRAGTVQYDEGHQVVLAGVAWAQHTGITGVQVQIDDGAWEDADLGETLSVDTWRQWSHTWTATGKGQHVLRVRAVDATGAVQTDAVADVVPDGATGLDSRTVTVV